MYPLFESIKVVDGQFINLEWHQQRVHKSRAQVLGSLGTLDLATLLEIPIEYRHGVVKCRVSYGDALGPVDFSNYIKKSIKSLQQIECTPFDYSSKFEDRSKLEHLYQLRGISDEVLITNQGMITDTSYSNVALFDGSDWHTPEKPLLAGTQRARLLASGAINKASIHISELGDFQRLVLINAMLEFEPEEFVELKDIRLWEQARVDTNTR